VAEVVAFAASCLEQQADASRIATTPMSTEAAGTMAAEFCDAEGVPYEAVLLGAVVSGSYCIAGIALLARLSGRSPCQSTPMREAVVRALVASGDATTRGAV